MVKCSVCFIQTAKRGAFCFCGVEISVWVKDKSSYEKADLKHVFARSDLQRCVHVYSRSPVMEMLGQQKKEKKKEAAGSIALRLGLRSNSPWREHMFSPRTAPILRYFSDIDPGLMCMLHNFFFFFCTILRQILKTDGPICLISGSHVQPTEPKIFHWEKDENRNRASSYFCPLIIFVTFGFVIKKNISEF